MSPFLIFVLCIAMLGTSFLSGIFGMAGGMILIGILLTLMTVPDAMMLHGVTQLASNGWRGFLWIKHVRWHAVISYIVGCTIALLLWSLTRYVPSKPIALILLGLTPFMVRWAPRSYRPNPESARQGVVYGAACMTLILLTGVAGPLVDTFFLGGKLDRREIVATKAICQIFGHAAKLLYFGALIDQTASINPVAVALAVACSMIGTTLAAKVLLAMTDQQYRSWTNRIITGIAGYYVAHGTILTVSTRVFAQ
ncbi:MAG TPA: sulfite exporter TauE/SafE family protein [Anaerolineae bacterium]|nr:sulfite exporter TauE/SafE family protein [Anaerolineae bacterium]